MAPAKPRMPGKSMRDAIVRKFNTPLKDSSRGIHRAAMRSAVSAKGILMKNVMRHPHAATSTPPRGSPTTDVTTPAI